MKCKDYKQEIMRGTIVIVKENGKSTMEIISFKPDNSRTLYDDYEVVGTKKISKKKLEIKVSKV